MNKTLSDENEPLSDGGDVNFTSVSKLIKHKM